MAAGNADTCQAAKALSLDVPQIGTQSKHGIATWGQPDWQEASIPFSSTGTFTCLHHEASSTCRCQLCVYHFPKVKRDLSLFEVFLGPLILQFKNCLHKEQRAILMDANEDISNPQLSSQSPMLCFGWVGRMPQAVFLCASSHRYASLACGLFPCSQSRSKM